LVLRGDKTMFIFMIKNWLEELKLQSILSYLLETN